MAVELLDARRSRCRNGWSWEGEERRGKRKKREEDEMKSRCGDKKSRRRRKTVEAGDTNTFRIGIWRIAGEEPIRGRYGSYGIFYGILYRVSRGTIGFFSLFGCALVISAILFFFSR